MNFPVSKGSYILWLYLPRRTAITIGRLGKHSFSRGWYGYCGSALGTGGLRARLFHHLRPVQRCHWHIDYFKLHASLRKIWLCEGGNREHDFSRSLLTVGGAELPLTGFGSTDCACTSHLVYVPAYTQVKESFRLLFRDSPAQRPPHRHDAGGIVSLSISALN